MLRLALSIAERAHNAALLLQDEPERMIRDAMHALMCDLAEGIAGWKPDEGQPVKEDTDWDMLAAIAEDVRMLR